MEVSMRQLILLIVTISISSTLSSQTSISLVELYGGRVDYCDSTHFLAFDRQNFSGYYNVYSTDSLGVGLTNITDKPAAPQKHNGNPTWHPSGDWIVFQSQIDSSANIFDVVASPGLGVYNNLWATDSEGSQFWPLTSYPLSLPAQGVLHPHFSADGSKVLWAHLLNDNLGPHGHWMIHIADFTVDINGIPSLQNIQNIHPGTADYLMYETHGFSPTGDTIYFSSPMENASFFDWDEYAYDLNSYTLTNLTESPGVWDEFAQISPDGSKIVWASSEGYPIISPSLDSLRLDWWIMDADGTNKMQLTHFNTPGYPEYSSERRGCADLSWGTNPTNFFGLVQSENAGLGSIVNVQLGDIVDNLSEYEDTFQFHVFPNPAQEQISLRTTSTFDNISLRVLNTIGELVIEEQLLSGPEIQIRTDNLSSGIYLIHLFEKQRLKYVGKFFIE